MSITLTCEEGWVISHADYSEIRIEDFDFKDPNKKTLTTFKLNPKLFEIKSPFKTFKVANKSKRKEGVSAEIPTNTRTEQKELTTDAIVLEGEISDCEQIVPNCGEISVKVATLSKPLIKEGRDCGVFKYLLSSSKEDNNLDARKIALQFYEEIKEFLFFPKLTKVNEEGVDTKTILFDGAGNFHNFILPRDCIAHCEDIKHLQNLVELNKYSLIVMDPPWRNKYIRRRKRKQSEAGYEMMEDWDISKLPIKEITNDGAIVAVWCTNSETHKSKVVDEFFPLWEVDYVSTWYWLKVTQEGLPVCPFNEDTKKQPYESIILGRRKSTDPSTDSLFGGGKQLPQDSKVIVSIPSSIHSHKPPLVEVLRPYVHEQDLNSGNCLELFARYALPGFTSVGDQVLKLMHESLFTNVE